MTGTLYGPDLRNVRSLAEQLDTLDEARATGDVLDYARAWIVASEENGGSPSALWRADAGPADRAELIAVVILDDQEQQRRLRRDALRDHHRGIVGFEAAVERILVSHGRYVDNRRSPLRNIVAVTRAFIATGGTLLLPPVDADDHAIGFKPSNRLIKGPWSEADDVSARAMDRVLKQRRSQPALRRIIAMLGRRTGNGWLVLKGTAA